MDLRQFIPIIGKIPNKEYDYTFTVFTPVFNAEKTIERVHDSLLIQSFTDFEWIIINDGSTDNTHQVILDIIKDSPLRIHYVNNIENQHKMACFFQAIEIAKGHFFLTFDADDECYPYALEVFNREYQSLSKEEKTKIVAITGLCVDQNEKPIGNKFPQNPLISNTFETTAIRNIKGEKWGFTSTKHLQSITYNNCFIENGFMMEGIIWCLLAKNGYLTKYINTVVRIYHIDVENSISSSERKNTAFGAVIYHIAIFNWFFRSHGFKAPKFFLKNLYFLLSNAKYLNLNLKNYITSIDSYIIKLLFVLLWPFKKFMT